MLFIDIAHECFSYKYITLAYLEAYHWINTTTKGGSDSSWRQSNDTKESREWSDELSPWPLLADYNTRPQMR